MRSGGAKRRSGRVCARGGRKDETAPELFSTSTASTASIAPAASALQATDGRGIRSAGNADFRRAEFMRAVRVFPLCRVRWWRSRASRLIAEPDKDADPIPGLSMIKTGRCRGGAVSIIKAKWMEWAPNI
ncbi:hypothetical protein GCM10009544_36640 [Streptomyces stramineus]|uniref:Uncharacterized protein n=1 Tax=Streptomyces stramineus TaxID=173861 RepID=A0ABN1A9Y9_9ACTN